MPLTKLKNIVILLLALTNVCLLILTVGGSIQSRRLEEQARADALLFLRERGVEVDESAIPQTVGLSPQVSERDLEEEQNAAAALLNGQVSVEARGGEVYRYFNENGFIQFHSDGGFSAQLEPDCLPAGEDRAAAGLAALELLGFQGVLLEDEGDELRFRQTWKDAPLFTQQVTLVYQEDCLTAMTAGRRLMGTPKPDQTRQSVTVATALVEFFNGVSALGDVCNRIDAIEEGYVVTANLAGVATLTPVWRVTTDTGAYQLDTVSAAVSRVEQSLGRSVDPAA